MHRSLLIAGGAGIAIAIAIAMRGGLATSAHALTPTPTNTPLATWTPPPTATATPPGFEPQTIFSVDAVPGAAIDATRVALVGERFSVDLVVENGANLYWRSYHAYLAYGDATLDPILPEYWWDPPVLNQSPGNVGPGDFCAPVNPIEGVLDEDDFDLALIGMGCQLGTVFGNTNYEGVLVQFVFECEAAGIAPITVLPLTEDGPSTALVEFPQNPPVPNDHHNDAQRNATIECVEAATATPTSTRTPTATRTPTVTRTPTPSATVTPLNTPTQIPPGVTPTTIFYIDAVPGGPINATRNVPLGTRFSVDLVVDNHDGPTWDIYEAEVRYSDEPLDVVLPASWADEPALDVSGGNVFDFPSGEVCTPGDGTQSATDDDFDVEVIAMFCEDQFKNVTNDSGPLVQFVFECEREGVATILPMPEAEQNLGTFLFYSTPPVRIHSDAQYPATILCGGAAPDAPRIEKAPQGNANNVAVGDPPLANLFLCEDPDQSDEPDGLCDGDNEGKLVFTEHAFSPSPLGAFEFQIKFDHKIFDIDLECVTETHPDPACSALDAATWDIALADDLLNDPFRVWSIDQCFRNVTENYINFACTSTGPPDAGLTGEIDLATVTLRPDADLKFRLSPGNDNGIVRVILDENCELVDPLGHPVEGSIAGGLTAACGDLAVTVRILEGDLDLDCDVDLADAQAIAQRYGTVFGLFLYDPWYDLEPNIKDFDIDAKDIQKVFGRIGSTCQAPVPPQLPVAPPQV